jgi:phage tail P2-like protein
MISTIELVPDSLRNDPQVIAACAALDIELEEIYAEIPDVAFWTNLENVVPPLLDVLVWEYHVDLHQMVRDGSLLTDEQKRQLIDDSIPWHQHKGTKWAVETACEVVFATVLLYEWFEYGGNPFFFRLLTNEALTSPELVQRLMQVIYETKNVRSHLEEFVVSQTSDLMLYHGMIDGQERIIRIPIEVERESIGTVYVGVGLAIYKELTIFYV